MQDFFIDFDPLRHDEVTENQFKLALDRALGPELQPTDTQKLANFFRSKKNRDMIAYRQFCREVDFCKALLLSYEECQVKPLTVPIF